MSKQTREQHRLSKPSIVGINLLFLIPALLVGLYLVSSTVRRAGDGCGFETNFGWSQVQMRYGITGVTCLYQDKNGAELGTKTVSYW